MLVTYQLQLAWLPPSLAGLVIGALFILPFVLSATAAQLADKLDKALLMRFVKSLEIGIMALAGWAFVQTDDQVRVATLLACVFAMGLHSTLFGPVKFALPAAAPGPSASSPAATAWSRWAPSWRSCWAIGRRPADGLPRWVRRRWRRPASGWRCWAG